MHSTCMHDLISQVREALGVRRTIISGGGSLAGHLDDFFEVGGVLVAGAAHTEHISACNTVST
jgi:long-chain acyl-CoA synthetase